MFLIRRFGQSSDGEDGYPPATHADLTQQVNTGATLAEQNSLIKVLGWLRVEPGSGNDALREAGRLVVYAHGAEVTYLYYQLELS